MLNCAPPDRRFTRKIARLLPLVAATFAFFAFQRNPQVIQEPVPGREQVYTIVENMPEYPGGLQAILKYLGKVSKYPPGAGEPGCHGVHLSFVVDAKGKIQDAKITKSGGAALDAELLRVVRAMPNWKPGTHYGKPVAVQYSLPIRINVQ